MTMQNVIVVCLAVVCLAVAAFGIGGLDGGLDDFESIIGLPPSSIPLDLDDEGLENKMVGGYRAAKNAFPFVAYVRFGKNVKCTGSLVHPRWVLTARCNEPLDGSEVVLGQYDRKVVDESTQIFTVSQIVRFNDSTENAFMLKLSSRANIRGEAVGVVDLVSSSRVMDRAIRNEMKCVQLGWGYNLRDFRFVAGRFLRAVGVNFVDETELTRRGYAYYLRIGYNIGTEAEYTNECEYDSMCNGDNGGPIVCRRGKTWTLTAMYAAFMVWDGCMTGVKATKNGYDLYDWVQATIGE